MLAILSILDFTYILLASVTLVEHRAQTVILQPILFWTLLSICSQMLFVLFMSASDYRCNVFFAMPPFLFLCGFKINTCFVMKPDDFHNVCPFHQLHSLFLISSSCGSSFVLCDSTLLLMVSNQRILGTLSRQLFTSTSTFWWWM